LLFIYLETIGVIVKSSSMFEKKPNSIMGGNLNSGLSYLITTVKSIRKGRFLQLVVLIKLMIEWN
jgi:hypothetical protein